MIKKIMKMTGFLAATVVLLCLVSAAEWQTNYDTALKMAASQGKLVLADFTGSDWCYYCIRLRKDVLDEPGFSAWAKSHFVLLEIDMPENPDFDATLRRASVNSCLPSEDAVIS
jgi:thioredoxin-related protein